MIEIWIWDSVNSCVQYQEKTDILLFMRVVQVFKCDNEEDIYKRFYVNLGGNI